MPVVDMSEVYRNVSGKIVRGRNTRGKKNLEVEMSVIAHSTHRRSRRMADLCRHLYDHEYRFISMFIF